MGTSFPVQFSLFPPPGVKLNASTLTVKVQVKNQEEFTTHQANLFINHGMLYQHMSFMKSHLLHCRENHRD